MPASVQTASKPFRILAFMISVCSAYKALATCFYIINLSASLCNDAKPSSPESQFLNISTDDVSFCVFIFFI